jgi:phosphatidylglycerol---prolipoprotein diacylglyceryl transferase
MFHRLVLLAEGTHLVHRWNPVMFQVGPVRLWYYGLAYAIGFLTVRLWLLRRRDRLGWSRSEVLDFSILFAAAVLLVGRAFDIAVYEWGYYREHWVRLLSFWEGGMATHGVLPGAVVGTALYCWIRNKSFFQVADEFVIPGAVIMALGRLGNQINGEVYGSVTDSPWAMIFPYAVGPRHPVALYDGAKNLLLVPILLFVRRGELRSHGVILGHFLFWYGFLRLFVDYFRDYDSYWLGIGRGQYFNLLMAIAGLGVIACRRRAPGDAGQEASAGSPCPEASWAALLAKGALFDALLLFCLTIPSGWTQEVLETMRMRRAWVQPEPGIVVDIRTPLSNRPGDTAQNSTAKLPPPVMGL